MPQENQHTPPPAVERVADNPHVAPGRGFWVLMALSLAAVGAVAYLQFARVEKAKSGGAVTATGALPVLLELPEFSLIERSGKPLTKADFLGKVWVADFIFTNCAGPCPVMSRRMGDLQQELLRDRMESVVCVSITVDPERDTPEALREYAETRSADPNRWLFLTGEKKPVRSLIADGFKLTVPRTPDEEEELLHSTRFVLVDRQGRVRGYYSAIAPEEDEDMVGAMDRPMPANEKRRLLEDIQSLLREGGR